MIRLHRCLMVLALTFPMTTLPNLAVGSVFFLDLPPEDSQNHKPTPLSDWWNQLKSMSEQVVNVFRPDFEELDFGGESLIRPIPRDSQALNPSSSLSSEASFSQEELPLPSPVELPLPSSTLLNSLDQEESPQAPPPPPEEIVSKASAPIAIPLKKEENLILFDELQRFTVGSLKHVPSEEINFYSNNLPPSPLEHALLSVVLTKPSPKEQLSSIPAWLSETLNPRIIAALSPYYYIFEKNGKLDWNPLSLTSQEREKIAQEKTHKLEVFYNNMTPDEQKWAGTLQLTLQTSKKIRQAFEQEKQELRHRSENLMRALKQDLRFQTLAGREHKQSNTFAAYKKALTSPETAQEQAVRQSVFGLKALEQGNPVPPTHAVLLDQETKGKTPLFIAHLEELESSLLARGSLSETSFEKGSNEFTKAIDSFTKGPSLWERDQYLRRKQWALGQESSLSKRDMEAKNKFATLISQWKGSDALDQFYLGHPYNAQKDRLQGVALFQETLMLSDRDVTPKSNSSSPLNLNSSAIFIADVSKQKISDTINTQEDYKGSELPQSVSLPLKSLAEEVFLQNPEEHPLKGKKAKPGMDFTPSKSLPNSVDLMMDAYGKDIPFEVRTYHAKKGGWIYGSTAHQRYTRIALSNGFVFVDEAGASQRAYFEREVTVTSGLLSTQHSTKKEETFILLPQPSAVDKTTIQRGYFEFPSGGKTPSGKTEVKASPQK